MSETKLIINGLAEVAREIRFLSPANVLFLSGSAGLLVAAWIGDPVAIAAFTWTVVAGSLLLAWVQVRLRDKSVQALISAKRECDSTSKKIKTRSHTASPVRSGKQSIAAKRAPRKSKAATRIRKGASSAGPRKKKPPIRVAVQRLSPEVSRNW